MSEREKFEKWLQDTWNQFGDFSLNRPDEEHQYEDMSVQDMWVGWQAALSTRKAYGYGIVDKDGDSIQEVYGYKSTADELVKIWNSDPRDCMNPHRVVELFYEDSES